jgi:hypothetical protein
MEPQGTEFFFSVAGMFFHSNTGTALRIIGTPDYRQCEKFPPKKGFYYGDIRFKTGFPLYTVLFRLGLGLQRKVFRSLVNRGVLLNK